MCDDDVCVVGRLLAAPSVSYCFPLLRAIVMSRVNNEHDESLVVKCLDLLSTHAARLRSSDPRDEVDCAGVEHYLAPPV